MRPAYVRVVLILCVCAMVASAGTAFAQEPAPSDLRAMVSGSSVVILWRAPGGAMPDGFRLEAGSAPGLTDLAVVNIPWNPQQGVDGHFAAAGVAPGVYYVRVRGVYGRTVTAASGEVMMRVSTSGCPLPNAPRTIHATVAGEVVTLNWDVPSGSEPAGYVIEAGSTPGAPNLAIITLDSTSVSVTAPPGRYFVRLRSMGLCGASEPSPEVVVTVPEV